MKRVIVIGEGQTEQEFCKDVLIPHFSHRNIFLQNPTIKHTGGGIIKWPLLKTQIENHLKQDKTSLVTTLIDYYGIYDKHSFPGWAESKIIVDKSTRLCFIEDAMKNDIDGGLRHRFIPYLQLHEFEGLLFTQISAFRNNFTSQEADINTIENIVLNYPNPELINDGTDTAPSKRLHKLIKGYNKVVYGAILASEIGLPNIRAKCPRFNAWIETLEN
ncbi:MAG: DUF4276 family protein [Bacteroidetes bacterium]|nr:DUF4276 family protein [Bacteroidota bacterium]